MSAQSDTPRTDAACGNVRTTIGGDVEFTPCCEGEFVRSEDMDLLELELNEANAVFAEQKAISDAQINLKSSRIEELKSSLQSLKDDMSQRLAELEAVENERDEAMKCAAVLAETLKSHDTWRRKEENQSQSKEGYRESTLCHEVKQALAAHAALTTKGNDQSSA